MLELSALLLPFLLTDIVNPVLLAFMVYAAGTDRPLANSSATLLGHTAAYLAFGIILALALEPITDRLSNPKPLDYGLGLLIGLLLLWVAWRSRSTQGRRRSPSPETPV